MNIEEEIPKEVHEDHPLALIEKGRKPILTICILAKSEIVGLTVASLLEAINCADLNRTVTLQPCLALGQSDLPKARSEQLSVWYRTASNGDYFLFVDADQTFRPADIFRSLLYSLNADVVCGSYSRLNGTMTVEPKDVGNFYQNKSGELWYGSTGFMMISYPIVDKLVKFFKKPIQISNKTSVYPFFYERIVDEPELNRKELWLSEDYSFCWLVRQHGAKVFGYISSIGHVIPKEHFVEMPDKIVWDEKSIVVYCGPTAESWSPKSMTSRGLGGSETAIVRLAPYWVKQGYRVDVFCNCGEDSGTYDGVHYHREQAFNFTDDFNILIVWRVIEVLNLTTVKAKKCILDLHDIVKPELLTTKVLSNVHHYCVKSKYHASMLTGVDESKIHVIPNGGAYDVEIEEVKKDPNYLIYASSYDRGLAYMLKWGWPKIKKACPDAYLKIFYGWEGFDKLNPKTPDVQLYKDILLELMKQPGVMEMGRIKREDLLKEKVRANIHYYMGNFQEIDCISVRESACLGVIPVVPKEVHVFEEKDYCITIDGNPEKQETQECASKKIIELIQQPKMADKIRKKMKVPKDETWEETAGKWVRIFG